MARPLLDVVCVTEDSCEYPVALKVNKDDGTVQTNTLQFNIHPNFKEAMDALDRMFDCFEITGYQYKETNRRKNRTRRSNR